MGQAVAVVDIEKGHSLAEAVEGIARKHEQAWNTHDRRAYESLFTDEADFVNVIAQHARGRDQIGRDFEQIHRTLCPNVGCPTLPDSAGGWAAIKHAPRSPEGASPSLAPPQCC